MLRPTTLSQPARRLVSPLSWQGEGLHTGCCATLWLRPHAEAGWWVEGEAGRAWPLSSARMVDSRHTSVIELPDGRRLAGLEHVLAALSGLWVDGVCLALDGAEAPALDGSAMPFAASLQDAVQPDPSWPRRALALQQPIALVDGDRSLHLHPFDRRRVRCQVHFAGHDGESVTWEDAPAATLPRRRSLSAPAHRREGFAEQLAPARTFAFAAWLATLRNQGLVKGGSLGNAVLLDDAGRPLNPEGLRFDDELARHKLVDFLGDLARLGAPLLADVDIVRPGHALNQRLVDRLLQSLSSHQGETP